MGSVRPKSLEHEHPTHMPEIWLSWDCLRVAVSRPLPVQASHDAAQPHQAQEGQVHPAPRAFFRNIASIEG